MEEGKIDYAKLEDQGDDYSKEGAKSSAKEETGLICLHIVAKQVALAKAHGGYDEGADGSKGGGDGQLPGRIGRYSADCDGHERIGHEHTQKGSEVQGAANDQCSLPLRRYRARLGRCGAGGADDHRWML